MAEVALSSILLIGYERGAWFRDSEGNMLGLGQPERPRRDK
jgi:hypothetical protein